MRIKQIVLFTALASVLSAASVSAHEGGWEPSLGVGAEHWDGERGLWDEKIGYLGLGYHLNEDWVVEPFLIRGDTRFDDASLGDVEYDLWGLKGQFAFSNRHDKVVPYLALGLAYLDAEAVDIEDADDTDTGVLLGLGAKINLTERLGLRIEFDNVRFEDAKTDDQWAFIGLSYVFGGVDHTPVQEMPVVKAAPAEVPVPAPLPAPPKDSDGDGVYDDADQCPNTAAGRKVDEKGCEKVLREKVSIKLNVLFETARTDIKSESTVEIKRVADFMTDYPTTKVVIEGHTDSIGSNELNKSLSERRAKAVADALVRDYGIDAGRVSSVGYGEERPLADNSTAEGRAQNRRVTAEIEETVVVSP